MEHVAVTVFLNFYKYGLVFLLKNENPYRILQFQVFRIWEEFPTRVLWAVPQYQLSWWEKLLPILRVERDYQQVLRSAHGRHVSKINLQSLEWIVWPWSYSNLLFGFFIRKIPTCGTRTHNPFYCHMYSGSCPHFLNLVNNCYHPSMCFIMKPPSQSH